MPDPASPALIALDLDGTLLGPDGRVSHANLTAIRDAMAAGVHVAIATGRRHSYALNVLRDLALPAETLLVSSNGAVVRTFASALIERTHMHPGSALWLCGHLADFRRSLVITFDTVGPDGQDTRGALVVEHLEELHSSIDRWMTQNAPYIAHVDPIEDCLRDQTVQPIQMMLCGSVERMRQAEARLVQDPRVAAVGNSSVHAETTISLNRTEYADRDLSILDILPAGCSKGATLLRLAAARGIDAADLMVIGDNYNDLSMLEVAGQPVLMGNAPDDLQLIAAERGWHITSTNEQDGVAEAIYSTLKSSTLKSSALKSAAATSQDSVAVSAR